MCASDRGSSIRPHRRSVWVTPLPYSFHTPPMPAGAASQTEARAGSAVPSHAMPAALAITYATALAWKVPTTMPAPHSLCRAVLPPAEPPAWPMAEWCSRCVMPSRSSRRSRPR